jgi:hypothetical protein
MRLHIIEMRLEVGGGFRQRTASILLRYAQPRATSVGSAAAYPIVTTLPSYVATVLTESGDEHVIDAAAAVSIWDMIMVRPGERIGAEGLACKATFNGSDLGGGNLTNPRSAAGVGSFQHVVPPATPLSTRGRRLPSRVPR